MYKISPQDIAGQTFKKVIRGYDPVEVDTFLEMVSVEFDRLMQKNEEIEEQIRNFGDQYKQLEADRAKLERALENVNKQEPAIPIKAEDTTAGKSAAPDQRVKETTEQAQRELKHLRDDIAILKEKKAKFIRRLKKDLRAQIELLKILEADSAAAEGENVPRRPRKGIVPERPAAEPKQAGPPRKTARIRRESPTDTAQAAAHGAAPVKESRQPEPEPVKKSQEPVQKKPQPLTPEQMRKSVDEISSEETDADDSEHRLKIQDGFNLIDNLLDDENLENGEQNEEKQD